MVTIVRGFGWAAVAAHRKKRQQKWACAWRGSLGSVCAIELITQRSRVQIPPPQPVLEKGVPSDSEPLFYCGNGALSNTCLTSRTGDWRVAMSTDEYKELLDRDGAEHAARELIDAACPLLRELVNHATWAFVRCSSASDEDRRGGENEDLAPFVLYRLLIEQVDGIEVLLSRSCADAAVPLLRSAFETSLALTYILSEESSYRERSLAWVCAYIHKLIHKHEQYDPSTRRGAERAEVLRKRYDITVPPCDSKPAIEGLRRVLARPEFATLNPDYLARAAKRAPNWFSLLGGPADRHQLAKRVGLESDYLVLYGDWSSIAHGATAAPYVRHNEQNEVTFKCIRAAAELPQQAFLAATFLLRATRLMIRHFRPGENLEQWYRREVQQRYQRLTEIWVTGKGGELQN
jgi:hypothetical protein